VTGRVSSKYQTEQFYSFFNRPDDKQDSYAITNLSLAYEPTDSQWRLQGYVNNVSDEQVFSNAGPNDRSFNYTYSYMPPRTYGVRLFYKW
jgi:iron complex outermembrane receptor protein